MAHNEGLDSRRPGAAQAAGAELSRRLLHSPLPVTQSEEGGAELYAAAERQQSLWHSAAAMPNLLSRLLPCGVYHKPPATAAMIMMAITNFMAFSFSLGGGW